MMPFALLCPVLGILFPIVWVIATYNLLIRLRNHCREAWAGIETELKRRYDLIPNLVETVRGYAAHERQVLEGVTAARQRAVGSTGSPAHQAGDENQLASSMRQLWAVAEGYPQLKADANFLRLQQELINTEDRIQAARRFFNANVRDLNNRIQMFPSNLIAGLFGFVNEEFFEVQEAVVRAPPQVFQ